MKKLLFIFLISINFMSINLYSYDGEFAFKITNASGNSVYTLKFLSIQGQNYFMCDRALVPNDSTLDFIFSNAQTYNYITADYICDTQANEGDLDDYGNRFTIYDGKYKVVIYKGEFIESYFYMNYKHCNYQNFPSSGDIFFSYDAITQLFTQHGYEFSGDYGTFSNGEEFRVWEDYYALPEPEVQDTSCYSAEIYVQNIIGGSPYGFVIVNGNNVYPNNTVTLNQGSNLFETYSELVENNQKFRNWNNNELENMYENPTSLIVRKNNHIFAYFYPTHPLTVNNYLEGGSGGTYDVHWQAADTTETGINSGVSYDAFEYRNPTLDKYNITVPSSISSAYGTSWYFIEWDDGTYNTTLSNFQVTAPTAKTAYYKGSMRSDDVSAYSNSGQRKVLRTSDGNIYHVYESMGKVWLEKSTDEGNSWTLINNGEPLNASAYEGLSPSLCVDNDNNSGNNFYVVFQEKAGNSSHLKLQYYKNGSAYWFSTVLTGSAYLNFASDMHPVIAKSGNNRLLVVWRVPSSEGNTPGLFYHYISHNSSSSTLNYLNPGNDAILINNTGSSSMKPSLAVYSSNKKNPFYLVWQHGLSEIRYCKLSQNTYSTGIIQQNYEIISTGSGFSSNYNPSITLLNSINHYPTVNWIGNSLGIGIGEDGGGTAYKRVVRRNTNQYNTWGFFYQMGDEVVFAVNNATDSFSDYAIAWAEDHGGGHIYDKFVLNGIYNNIKSLNATEKYLQLSNGSDLNNMYGITYSTAALPYDFEKTESLGSLSKENVLAISSGRQGVAYIDTAEFYFAFGDVELNGSPVEFEEIVDSNYVNDLAHINQYLRTKPFTLSGGDALTYSVLYGLTDSLFSTQILGEDNFVHFKVELIDENTNEVLGLYDDITYDLNNLNLYDNIAYSINTDGIGTKTVRLRLVVEDNLGGGYGFSKIFAEGSALGKNRSFLEVPYQGSLKVEKYALLQNYPNPFNPATTIKYEIPETGFVTLKIYDILGREVTTLVNAKQEAGRYEAKFNAGGLSSGIYIYRIQAGKFAASKKMILLK